MEMNMHILQIKPITITTNQKKQHPKLPCPRKFRRHLFCPHNNATIRHKLPWKIPLTSWSRPWPCPFHEPPTTEAWRLNLWAAKTPGFSPRMPGPVVVNMKILVPGSRTGNILGGNIRNYIYVSDWSLNLLFWRVKEPRIKEHS